MKLFRKRDLLILAAVAIAALLLYLFSSGVLGRAGTFAEIYYRSELVKTVALTEGREERFSLEQEPQVVFRLYEDGAIAFEASDCPDKICIRSGKLRKAGQMAACLPNEIVVRIVSAGGASSDEPDIAVG